MRKPVGVAALGNDIFVVCEDGSTWKLVGSVAGWVESRPIPGSERQGIIDPNGYQAQVNKDDEAYRRATGEGR